MKALFLIKPDGINNYGKIFKVLNDNDVKILGLKSQLISQKDAEILYQDLKDLYFFPTVVKYITSGPCLLLAIEIDQAILKPMKQHLRDEFKAHHELTLFSDLVHALNRLSKTERDLLIQDDLHIQQYKTEYLSTLDGIHCSDPSFGEIEIALFFKNEELVCQPMSAQEKIDLIVGKLVDKQLANQSTNIAKLGIFNH